MDKAPDGAPAAIHPDRGASAAPGPPCPFCDGSRTEVMSLFGSHASLTTCWCADCRSPFEVLRWRGGSGRSQNPVSRQPAESDHA